MSLASARRRPPPATPGGGDRAVAPGHARGALRVRIPPAHVPIYLAAQERSSVGAHPLDGSSLDRAVQAVMLVAVDLRVYPMFALLFGYGLVLSTRRQQLGGALCGEISR